MIILKTVLHNRKILLTSMLSAAIYWGGSFSLRLWPALLSRELKFIYLLSIPIILTAIGTFGLVSLVLILVANRKKEHPSRIWVTGFCLMLSFLVLTPLTLVLHRSIPRALPTGSDLRAFDTRVWQTETSTDGVNGVSARQHMLKNVVENVLPGKNKQEIENALGRSMLTMNFQSSDKDLIYYVGPERDGVFNMDSEWLLIWLDENGKYKRYMVTTD